MAVNFDQVFKWLANISAYILLGMVATLLITLVWLSWPSLHHYHIHFLSSATWNPAASQFGALSIIIDTLIASFLAVLIALPFSFLTAVCITNMLSLRVGQVCSRIIELMAAVPSIIYGIWGLFVLGPYLAEHCYPHLLSFFSNIPVLDRVFFGIPVATTILTASIILALMIYPLITAMMRDVLASIPGSLKEACYGIGVTRLRMVTSVFIHYVRAGLLGSIILGLGRALGETMAVTFVIGNSHAIFQGLLMPGSTIAATIANEFTEASAHLYQAALIELALILFVISLITLLLSRFIMSKSVIRGGSQ